MIEYYSPSRRKPHVVTYPQRHQAYEYKAPVKTDTVPAMFAEAARRDTLIKDIVKKLDYKEGDIVQPQRETDAKKYGTNIVVEKICDTYGKYGKEKWPESDNPFIVHVWCPDVKSRFACTHNWLKPANT